MLREMSKRLDEELKKIDFKEIAGANSAFDAVNLDLNLYDGRNTCLGYADVLWKSDKPHIVSPSGFVNGGDKLETVKLTAVFTFQEYPDIKGERSFFVSVLPGKGKAEKALPNDKIRIFIAGDSTACSYPHTGENNRYPQTGWGQMFKEMFKDDVYVVNCARSGRSSKSFLQEDNYKYICDNIKAGDYLFIQFAHNDCKKEDPARYTSPDDGTYQDCIYEFINTAVNAGAHPVLLSSITRNIPSDNTLEPYRDCLCNIAQKEKLTYIDLYGITHKKLIDEKEKFIRIYLHLVPHDERYMDYSDYAKSQYFNSDRADNTHLNIDGAREVAKMVADELKLQNHSLADYLK